MGLLQVLELVADLQIQRLLELQSYLNGGISDWPTQMAEPLVKQEPAQVPSNNIDFSTAADPQLPSMPQATTLGLSRSAWRNLNVLLTLPTAS